MPSHCRQFPVLTDCSAHRVGVATGPSPVPAAAHLTGARQSARTGLRVSGLRPGIPFQLAM